MYPRSGRQDQSEAVPAATQRAQGRRKDEKLQACDEAPNTAIDHIRAIVKLGERVCVTICASGSV